MSEIQNLPPGVDRTEIERWADAHCPDGSDAAGSASAVAAGNPVEGSTGSHPSAGGSTPDPADTSGPSLDDTDERLIWVLNRCFDEWGPAGVARTVEMLRAALAAGGSSTPATPPPADTCDCANHPQQVCDICQGWSPAAKDKPSAGGSSTPATPPPAGTSHLISASGWCSTCGAYQCATPQPAVTRDRVQANLGMTEEQMDGLIRHFGISPETVRPIEELAAGSATPPADHIAIFDGPPLATSAGADTVRPADGGGQ